MARWRNSKPDLGERWRDTVIVVATEFGRTARINGTDGTDHGTGTVALLAGGAVKGGRVIADWPGLKPASLYEGRDLAPTTDLRAVIKGVLHDHLGVKRARAGGDGVSGQRGGEGDAGVGGVGRTHRRHPAERALEQSRSDAATGLWPSLRDAAQVRGSSAMTG